MAIRLCMHWPCPDHPYYSEILSLFFLQYYRAPEAVKDSINRSLFKKQYNGKVLYNDEIHEMYNSDVQDIVRSHRSVTVDHYLESTKKLPFIKMLIRSLNVDKRSNSHYYPTEIWEKENALIFTTLFFYYTFKEDRRTMIILQAGDLKEYETIDNLKVDEYIEKLTSKDKICNFLVNGKLKDNYPSCESF